MKEVERNTQKIVHEWSQKSQQYVNGFLRFFQNNIFHKVQFTLQLGHHVS